MCADQGSAGHAVGGPTPVEAAAILREVASKVQSLRLDAYARQSLVCSNIACSRQTTCELDFQKHKLVPNHGMQTAVFCLYGHINIAFIPFKHLAGCILA